MGASCMSLTTTITTRLSLSPSPNLEPSHFRERFYTFTGTKLSNPSVAVKCSSKNNSGETDSGITTSSSSGSLKDLLTGMVDERVEQLLNKEENRVMLDGLEKAAQRVELAKRDLAQIQRQEAEAKLARDYINKLQSRTSEIVECQKEILEAKSMVDEAERSLSISGLGDRDSPTKTVGEMFDKDAERLESIKAASISAIAGTLAGLPLSLTRVIGNSKLILPLAITFVSCALFGVTFRYAIRRDLDNFQLKTGTSAAFGFVKGLAVLGAGPPLELDAGSFLSHAFDGAVYVSESLLIFFFAATGLDFCMKLRILSPFPIEKSVDKKNEI